MLRFIRAVVLSVWVALVLGWPLAARAGGAIGGTRPWWVERIALASTTNWDVYTAPTWARQIVIRNAHASATLYLANYDETGAFVSGTDDYVTLPAGAVIVLPLSAGIAQSPDTSHLTIALYSATSSHPVEIVLVETPE